MLGTPRVLALAEAATVAATATRMPAGQTTSGCGSSWTTGFEQPVSRMVAQARLAAVEGSRLHFEVTVADGAENITEGVERVMVDRQRFVERASRAS